MHKNYFQNKNTDIDYDDLDGIAHKYDFQYEISMEIGLYLE